MSGLEYPKTGSGADVGSGGGGVHLPGTTFGRAIEIPPAVDVAAIDVSGGTGSGPAIEILPAVSENSEGALNLPGADGSTGSPPKGGGESPPKS